MKFIDNLPRILLLTFIFIITKNFLQIFFGIVTGHFGAFYDSLILIKISITPNSIFIFSIFYCMKLFFLGLLFIYQFI
jgi:hypothetical protein